MVLAAVCLLALVRGVASHGWLTKPVPRNVLICDGRGETEWGCKADRETYPVHPGDHPGPYRGNICSGDNDNGISREARQQMMRPGPIQAHYIAGQVAEMRWNVYADHGGWFSYRICLDGSDTEECFRKNILYNTADRQKNIVTHMSTSEYVTQVKIPEDITCDRCTLSWFWHGAPHLEDNIFVNCVDISIRGNGQTPNPLPTPYPTSPPSPTPSPTVAPSPTPVPSGPCAGLWEMCGGKEWSGPTCCQQGLECKYNNEWHSGCSPAASLAQVTLHRGRNDGFLK